MSLSAMPSNGLHGGISAIQGQEGDGKIVASAGAVSSALQSLTTKERRDYSIARLILASAGGNYDAGLEMEVSSTIAQKIGRPARNGGSFIPNRLKTYRSPPSLPI